jgi:hypothetical protein
VVKIIAAAGANPVGPWDDENAAEERVFAALLAVEPQHRRVGYHQQNNRRSKGEF